MKNAIYCTLLLVLVGCSSTQKISEQQKREMPDVVLTRSDNLGGRPDWIQETKPFRAENDRVVSLGTTTVPSDHRIEAAYRICFNSAKGQITSAISQKLEYVFQQSSEGTEMDHVTAQYIGSELSNLTTSSLRPTNQYFEKVATTTDSGERKTIYKIFCTVEMPMQDFKSRMYQAVREAEGKGKVSADFQKKVSAQWDQFVGAPSGQTRADQASSDPQSE